jgi:hypothetical protein
VLLHGPANDVPAEHIENQVQVEPAPP